MQVTPRYASITGLLPRRWAATAAALKKEVAAGQDPEAVSHPITITSELINNAKLNRIVLYCIVLYSRDLLDCAILVFPLILIRVKPL
jgi:hypothetical protein